MIPRHNKHHQNLTNGNNMCPYSLPNDVGSKLVTQTCNKTFTKLSSFLVSFKSSPCSGS